MPNLELTKGVDELFAEADLRECDLSGATLVGGMKAFYGTNFSAANLADANMVGEAAFQKAVFDKAILTDAVLKGDGCRFSRGLVRRSQFAKCANERRAVLLPACFV